MASDDEDGLADIWKQCDQAMGKDVRTYDETMDGRKFPRKRSRRWAPSPPPPPPPPPHHRRWWEGEDGGTEDESDEEEQKTESDEEEGEEKGGEEAAAAAGAATGGQSGRDGSGTHGEEQRRRARADEEQRRRAAEERARRAEEQRRRAAEAQRHRAEEQARRATAEQKARRGASARSEAWLRLGKRLKANGCLSLPLAIKALNGDEALRRTFELPYPESKIGEQEQQTTCNRDYVAKWFGIMIDHQVSRLPPMTRPASGATDGVTRAAFTGFVNDTDQWMKLDEVRRSARRA